MSASPAPRYFVSPLKDRTVFVTGHSGFVGSWLCTFLHQLGANLVGYSLSDDATTAARASWLKGLGLVATEGDLRDFSDLLAAVVEAQPDVMVHLAAQPILGRGLVAPHLTFDVNINGSLNVLEVAQRTSVPALIHVTSDKCYSPAAVSLGPVTEQGELGGEGPYPASKTIAEILFREFSELANDESSRMATVRLGNVVGGGDEADRLVPNWLRAFQAGRPFAMRDPDAVRPFQHVLDVVCGLERLGSALLERRLPNGLPLNFAPPHSGRTTAELVTQLAMAWGCGASISEVRDVVPFPEQPILRLDGSKASGLLDWDHELDLSMTAAWTVEWVQSIDQGMTAAGATAGQAARYLSMMGKLG